MDFEKASRLKLRFATVVGVLTVEDLWDLPLTSVRSANLDAVARGLYRDLKATEEDSFVEEATKTDERLQIAFDIVKHVIAVKRAESAAVLAQAAKKAEKQRILALIAEKKDAVLGEKSLLELEEMMAAL